MSVTRQAARVIRAQQPLVLASIDVGRLDSTRVILGRPAGSALLRTIVLAGRGLLRP